jgi:hypothetical protein
MGFLKKITRPISRVLDKIVPNEIKPALPFLAAAAPVFGPGMHGIGGNTMGLRALLSGGLNLGAQLAQEGSEGDINLLSAGLGALSGAMTAPGAADKFQGMKFGERGSGFIQRSPMGPVDIPYQSSFIDQTGISTLERGANIGLEGLKKGSEFLRPDGNVIPNLFSKEGLKIATAPAATATGDVMQASARQLEKQNAIDAALAEAEALEDFGIRGDAIRNAMRAYGFFTDEEIESTVSSAGYKAGGRVGFSSGDYVGSSDNETMEDEYDSYIKEIEMIGDKPMSFSSFKKMIESDYAKGGRVGFRFGGIGDAVENIKDAEIKESVKMVADMPDMDLMDLVEEFEIIFKRKPMNMEELKQFYRENYEMESPVKMKEKIKETITMKAKDGGLMNLGGKEMDLRGGGFVPIGKKEKADDVPARLSKNEFVMTADAVRAAGGGSVNEGAKRMYKVMNDLEARA